MNEAAGAKPDYQRLYDAAACGLLVTTAVGLITEVNRTFCEWVGRTPAELVGTMTVQSLLSMGGRIFHQTHWVPLLQLQGSLAEVKLEVLHKDGRRIPTIWNALRHAHDGIVTHELAVFVAEDRHTYEQELVLAKRRAEDALKALHIAKEALALQRAVAEDRALFAEQMVAVVSHDLRNPLSVISMSANLISRGDLSERQQRSLFQLNASTARAIRLIADLLDFSQARMGAGLKVTLAEIDLQAVVAESVAELQTAFPSRRLQHDKAGDGPCGASADRLMQMIGNLVGNAAAYGDPERPILVVSKVDDATFSIAVQNQGPAIPEAQLATLFEPMTRGAAETTVHSIGLGLYIVRQIVRAHGGEIAVQSTEGSGTTFTATFPRNLDAITADLPMSDATARERARQSELDRLEISTLQDSAYDDIVKLAADAFDVPIAVISLVDGDRQWFKARVGLQASETLRDYAFCADAIEDATAVLVVEDASADARFAANPLVTGDPHIRFYAGAPLVTTAGHALGTLCVIDTKPRTLDPKQRDTLRFMAHQVVVMMEQRVQGVLRKATGNGSS